MARLRSLGSGVGRGGAAWLPLACALALAQGEQPRRLQEGYPDLAAFTCPAQGTLAPGRTALLRQPDHDAVGKCAARCEADAGCVSFDAGTADGGTRCYRRPEEGGGVNGTSLSYQYFSLPGINASEDGCVPLARGCGRNGSALGAITRPRRGCTNATAFNNDTAANVDDGSCTDEIVGCQDPRATNYNAAANSPDAYSCEYPALDNFTCAEADKYLPGFNIIRTDVPGELNHYTGLTVEECAARCLASAECESFDFAAAAQPDGSQSMCFLGNGVASAENPLANATGHSYYEKAAEGAGCARGCTNAASANYALSALVDDGSCLAVVRGCTDRCAPHPHTHGPPPSVWCQRRRGQPSVPCAGSRQVLAAKSLS